MSNDLIFYTNPMSRGRIVRWMLEELGQPYQTVLLDYGSTMKAPAYLAVNPMGKVPALRHGDATVTECAAICAYLADAFPAARLAPPPDSRLRAAYFRYLFFAAGPVEAGIFNKVLGVDVPQERQGMVGYGNFATMTEVLEQMVPRKGFLLGTDFSAADVYFGSEIGWGMQFGTLEKRPAFEDYWARIKDRPAAIRAREIDDALISAAREPS